MNRGWIRKRRSGYLRMPALILILAAVFCIRSSVSAGDTEAENAAAGTVPVQEAGETTGQSKGAEEMAGRILETEEAAGQKLETEETSGQKLEREETAGQNRGAEAAAGEMRESEEPEWDEEASEPEGYYTVILDEIRPDLPEEGRVYDGTDRISLKYSAKVRREDSGEEEEVPPYKVICSARLEDCDAGRRQVIYSFALRTPYPDHIKLERDREYPKLAVEVKKAVLRVRIPDGTKAYMDPPDLEHISLSGNGEVAVSGFALDADGREVIPEGFIPPQITVDTRVLKQNSPMYRTGAEEEDAGQSGSDPAAGSLEGKRTVCRYEGALILKMTPDGLATGDPTANYEFCLDPEDDRYVAGCVTITRGEISPGEDYTIRGDEGAWRWLQDRVIVRQGTGLYADPVKGSGYNSGASSGALSGEGTFTFRLRKKDKSGSVTADSKEGEILYTADGTAPKPALSVTGAKGSGGYLYCASAAVVTAQVPEDMSGIREVRYRILRTDLTAGNLAMLRKSGSEGLMTVGSWKDGRSSGSASLSDEGIFRVEFEVTDGVGNRSLASSACIIVDRTEPSVTVDGVTDHSANAGRVIITAACSDAAYETGSFSVDLTAEHGGLVPKMHVIQENGTGAAVRFADFKHTRRADAVYVLTVRARDLAGNETVRTLSFSVNRSGSVYSLAEGTRQNLNAYYHRRPFAVCFTETNLDEVPSAKAVIRRGTSLRELVPGDGLLLRGKSRNRDGFRYVYTIPASAFQEDGIYEVILFTTDRAGNSSDSAARDIPVRFAIDQTPPSCLITGIGSGSRYPVEKLTAVAEVRDNLALAGVWIYVDSVLYRKLDSEALAQTDGLIKLPFRKRREWRTLQIRVLDCAGNEYWTSELEFLVSGKDDKGMAVPERRRLSAEQIALAGGWMRACCRKVRRVFWQDLKAEKMEVILRRDTRGAPAVSAAGGQLADVTHIRIEDLQKKRLHGLMAAAAVLPAALLIFILLYRIRRQRRVRRHSQETG